jgi:hypothetical protein
VKSVKKQILNLEDDAVSAFSNLTIWGPVANGMRNLMRNLVGDPNLNLNMYPHIVRNEVCRHLRNEIT